MERWKIGVGWLVLTAGVPRLGLTIAAGYGLYRLLRWRCAEYEEELRTVEIREADDLIQRPFRRHGQVAIPARVMNPFSAAGMVLSALGITMLLFDGLITLSSRVAGVYVPEVLGAAFDVIGMIVALAIFSGVAVLLTRLCDWVWPLWRAFKTYPELLRYVDASASAEEALARIPALRYAAKMQVRSPSDLYRIWQAARSDEDHSAFYRSERLLDALRVLERHFPQESADEGVRRRYWAIAQALYRLMLLRDAKAVEGSLFGKPYSKSAATLRQEREARMSAMAARPPGTAAGRLTEREALSELGLARIPDLATLKKLRQAALAEARSEEEAHALVSAFDRLQLETA